MPRFLDTSTGEFRWIADPTTVVYAILSHTWRSEKEGGEQTYNEVRKIWKRMKKAVSSGVPSTESTAAPTGPMSILSHPDLSDKIKSACGVACEAGYKLIWIDSACIDKSSSAELAEAINSMFDLYRLSNVCYVYLVDVPDSKQDPDHDSSAFRRSRWHKRGWTLQELIAPRNVVFLTASWTLLGTKTSLVFALSLETKIDDDILTGLAPLSSASVARRMSWAAYRKTTRIEDEAYSLLGIFGVYLSPIYGEGRNAFLRLQEEIMKTIPDQSLFAWGARCLLYTPDKASNKSVTPDHDAPTGLLATSPQEFSWAGDIRPCSPSDFLSLLAGRDRSKEPAQAREVPALHSVVTPEGVRMKVFTIDLTELPQFTATTISLLPGDKRLQSAEDYNHCLSLGRAQSLAVLRCTDEFDHLYTLALFHPASSGSADQNSLTLATHVKCKRSCPGSSLYRVISLEGEALEAALNHVSPKPVELSLLHHSTSSVPDLDSRNGRSYTPINLWPSSYRSSWYGRRSAASIDLEPLSREKLRVLGYGVLPLVCQRSDSEHEMTVTTSLFESSVLSRAKSRVHIQISLTLAHVEAEHPAGERSHRSTWWVPSKNTRVTITISRVCHVPPPEADDEDIEKPFCDSCECRGCVVKEWPSKGSNGSNTMTCTSIVSDTVKLPERTVAQASFVVPLSLEERSMTWDWGKSRIQYGRILRLAVECPLNYSLPESRFIPDLWLSIDLSGALKPAHL